MSKKAFLTKNIQANLEFAEGEKLATLEILKTIKVEKSTHGSFTITSDDLEQIINNFNDNIYGIVDEEGKPQLPLNFSHEKEKIAAGWIKELILSDDKQTLIAKVELTKIGRERAENKEFIYASAELFFEFFDPETKETTKNVLTGVALTNIPFVKGLKSIQLSELDLDMNQILKMIGNLPDEEKTIIFDKMRKMLNISSNNNLTKKEMTNNKKEMTETDNKLIAEFAEKQTKLEEKIGGLTKELQFAEMLADGKVVPAQKEAFLKGDFKEFAEKAHEKINFSQTSSSKSKKEEDDKKPKTLEEAENKVIELAEKLCKEDKSINFAEAQGKILEQNPDLNKLIYGEN